VTLYAYCWRNYLGLPSLEGKRKGETCKVLVRGSRNSALIEFVSDGFRAVVSRNALRRVRAHGS
jgi:hypothetical protein